MINRHRQVQFGLTGQEDGNSFVTDVNSLPAAIRLEFDGTEVGNYSNQNTMAHYFNLLDFQVLPIRMDEFEVTQYEDVGGFVNGYFKGESKNILYVGDETLYPIDGFFSILNQ